MGLRQKLSVKIHNLVTSNKQTVYIRESARLNVSKVKKTHSKFAKILKEKIRQQKTKSNMCKHPLFTSVYYNLLDSISQDVFRTVLLNCGPGIIAVF